MRVLSIVSFYCVVWILAAPFVVDSVLVYEELVEVDLWVDTPSAMDKVVNCVDEFLYNFGGGFSFLPSVDSLA